MTLRVGLLGAGFIAGVHLDAYARLQDVAVAGIADVNAERAAALAEKFEGARAYSDASELIARGDVDIVDICLPTFLHEEYVTKAARAGKHILCEKPIALDVDGADRMVQAARDAGVKFMVAHVVRFWPEYAAAKRLLDAGEIGKAIEVSATRLSTPPSWSAGGWILDPRQSGGAVVDLLIHDIDYANWLLGKPVSVYARGLKSETGGYDHILLTVSYAGGGVATLEGGRMMPSNFPFTTNFRILGERGCIDYSSRAGENIESRGNAASALAIYKHGEDVKYPHVPEIDAYLSEIGYFLDCVRNNTLPEIVTPEDALMALRVALAADQSIETGGPIVIS
ncbi:MAG: Gfo/Idh/MocA family oxidoreductase [Firmicutes bacterium]|nr:Gfo/Idh/MocA family oxidoreductase [Bacillota bacterium]